MSVLPKVSIVMPAYNAESTIAEAIKSVLRQTWPHWELLIVVDAATDRTLEVARQWANQDRRVKVFNCEVNRGVSGARNIALDQAQGRYVAFLDSDDLWFAHKLEAQVSYMESEGVDLCYGSYVRFDERGPMNVVVPASSTTFEQLTRSNVIGNLTGIVRRNRVADLRFRPIGHEDYLYWLSALRVIDVGCRLPDREPIGWYRVRQSSLSANKLRSLRWQWHIYRNELNLPLFKSAILSLHYAQEAIRKRVPVTAPPRDYRGE